MQKNQERINTIEFAEKLWSQLIAEHQLQCIKQDYIFNEFTIRLCYLNSGRWSTRGVGKGHSLAEINISASFEALEYYLAAYRYHPIKVFFASITEIPTQYPFMLYRGDHAAFMAEAKQGAVIPWVIYEESQNKTNMAVPLAAVDLSYRLFPDDRDKFNYEKCKIYAASNVDLVCYFAVCAGYNSGADKDCGCRGLLHFT